jgi:hypothetical protein
MMRRSCSSIAPSRWPIAVISRISPSVTVIRPSRWLRRTNQRVSASSGTTTGKSDPREEERMGATSRPTDRRSRSQPLGVISPKISTSSVMIPVAYATPCARTARAPARSPARRPDVDDVVADQDGGEQPLGVRLELAQRAAAAAALLRQRADPRLAEREERDLRAGEEAGEDVGLAARELEADRRLRDVRHLQHEPHAVALRGSLQRRQQRICRAPVRSRGGQRASAQRAEDEEPHAAAESCAHPGARRVPRGRWIPPPPAPAARRPPRTGRRGPETQDRDPQTAASSGPRGAPPPTLAKNFTSSYIADLSRNRSPEERDD